MTLTTTIIFKCRPELKKKLVDIAIKVGLSPSSIARNSLALVLCSEKEEFSTLREQIIAFAKQEQGLWVRDRNNG